MENFGLNRMAEQVNETQNLLLRESYVSLPVPWKMNTADEHLGGLELIGDTVSSSRGKSGGGATGGSGSLDQPDGRRHPSEPANNVSGSEVLESGNSSTGPTGDTGGRRPVHSGDKPSSLIQDLLFGQTPGSRESEPSAPSQHFSESSFLRVLEILRKRAPLVKRESVNSSVHELDHQVDRAIQRLNNKFAR